MVIHEGNDITIALNTLIELSNKVFDTSTKVGIVEIINTPSNDGLVEGKMDEISKTINNDDSLSHYSDADMGGFWFDY